MRIDPKSTIAGYPAMKVRDLMRYVARIDGWNEELAAHRLKISLPQAVELIKALETTGFIRKSELRTPETYWCTTIQGNSLGLAAAGKPISRATAERLISEFVERCREVNSNPKYLHSVKQASVFGSFLSNVPVLNDVDISIELVRKESDPDKYMKQSETQAREAEAAGRQFGTFVDFLCWSERYVTLFLKSRSTGISLHNQDPIIKQVAKEEIFKAD